MEDSDIQPATLIFSMIAFAAFLAGINSAMDRENDDSSISISPKTFSFKAPLGFVIGFAAVFMAFLTSKLDDYFESTQKVEQLKLEVERAKHNKTGVFQEYFKERSPKSIFSGGVLVEYDSPYIKFNGIRGIIENNKTGARHRSEIRIDDGTRFFIMRFNNTKWGVNTLKISPGRYAQLEFYPIK